MPSTTISEGVSDYLEALEEEEELPDSCFFGTCSVCRAFDDGYFNLDGPLGAPEIGVSLGEKLKEATWTGKRS